MNGIHTNIWDDWRTDNLMWALFVWKKCHVLLIMTSTKTTVFSQCRLSQNLTKEWLDKPAATKERHWASTGAGEQVGTLLSSVPGIFGWHLLENDPVITCQSPSTKVLVPSINCSASNCSVDILSGMSFSHVSPKSAVSKTTRCERDTQNHVTAKHQREVTPWTRDCQGWPNNVV